MECMGMYGWRVGVGSSARYAGRLGRGMGARSAAEAGGIVTGQLLRRLSVVTHASHMRVLYARLRYVGMSPAQAARGGDVGGAPGA